MLRFVVLLALPVAIFCSGSSAASRYHKQTEQYLKAFVKPCILHNRRCPSDGSWSFANIEKQVSSIVAMSTPEDCYCDSSNEGCVRGCYFAIIQKSFNASVAAGHVNLTDTLLAQLEMYKVCILENKECEKVGGLTYAELAQHVETYKKLYTLPRKCRGDLSEERHVRRCYYAFIRNSIFASMPSRKRRFA